MPFYKDPMSYGNLIVEFKVEFPKKNYFPKDKIERILQIFNSDKKPLVGNEKRDPKTSKILEDFNEADLNPNPEGGQEE